MIDKQELLTLIPHRGEMMMLSRVIKYDTKEKSIEAEYDITEDCLFFDSAKNGVPSWTGFELIAQAVSAFIGIRDRENGIPPKEGYILGISDMRMGLPILKNNSIITIKSIELDNVHPVYIFDGVIIQDGQEVLAGKITVMEVEKDKEKERENNQ